MAVARGAEMGVHERQTKAGRRYAEAHAAHYTRRNLEEALGLYRAIISEHPRKREAGYSRAQIKNIIEAVVPAKELFDAEVDMAVACFERDRDGVEGAPTAAAS